MHQESLSYLWVQGQGKWKKKPSFLLIVPLRVLWNTHTYCCLIHGPSGKRVLSFEAYTLRALVAQRKSFAPRPLSESLRTWLWALPSPWAWMPGASCPYRVPQANPSLRAPLSESGLDHRHYDHSEWETWRRSMFWRLQSSLQTQDPALFSGYSENFLSREMEFSKTTKGGKR